MENAEVLPVPPEMVPRLWKMVRRAFEKIPGYDVQRLHTRLLVGVDQLWVAFGLRPYKQLPFVSGVIVTSIAKRPPSRRLCFRRKDPAEMKSLVIHVAQTQRIESWLASAVERIGHYARQHECRQLFVLGSKYSQSYMKAFYSTEWSGVAFGRDRRTYSKCHQLSFRNTPGYFRPMVPVPREKWHRRQYNWMGTWFFKEAA